MNIQIIDKIDPHHYNKYAKHPLQSWEWGEARRAMGIDVMRFGLYEEDTLQEVFQVTFHSIPHTSLTIGYMPRSTRPSDQVIAFIKKEAQKRHCFFLKIEPLEKKASTAVTSSLFMIIPSKHPLFPPWTRIINLALTEEELLNQMKPKTRYNIRLSKKSGVEIREETTDEGFETFIKLYFETCKRQNYYGHTYKYHKQIFDSLKSSLSHILIAYYQGAPLAAYHVMIFNGVAYYVYGGSSVEHRKLMVSNLLMWESLRRAKKMGAHTFDMWGSLGPDYNPTHEWAGFSRFKEGFGGELVEYVASSDIVFHRTLYTIYNLAFGIRSYLMKARLL